MTSLALEVGTEWRVYLLQCSDKSLYAGITTDMNRRLQQHNGHLTGGARYTRGRRPVTVVWSETCGSRSEALQREAAVRRLSRRQKQALITALKRGDRQ
jgi:putative endonuclease